MITRQTLSASRPAVEGVEFNKVLKNTYALLSATLLFSGATAGLSMLMNWPHPGLVITLVGYFGLLFLAGRFRNSALGLLFVFALTGFMGLTLGPIVGYYINAVPNGDQLVMTALGGTGVIFLGLSAYALKSRKDFSIPALSLAVSAMFIILMSGMILYQTSAIIHGGETNYIMATITLYVSIYNLFLSLLQILGIFGGDD